MAEEMNNNDGANGTQDAVAKIVAFVGNAAENRAIVADSRSNDPAQVLNEYYDSWMQQITDQRQNDEIMSQGNHHSNSAMTTMNGDDIDESPSRSRERSNTTNSTYISQKQLQNLLRLVPPRVRDMFVLCVSSTKDISVHCSRNTIVQAITQLLYIMKQTCSNGETNNNNSNATHHVTPQEDTQQQYAIVFIGLVFLVDAAMTKDWMANDQSTATSALKELVMSWRGDAWNHDNNNLNNYYLSHVMRLVQKPFVCMCKTFTEYFTSMAEKDSKNDDNMVHERNNSHSTNHHHSKSVSSEAASAITILKKAHNILRPAEGHLTPIQPLLLLCCLLSKHYRFAERHVLNELITDMEPHSTSVTQTDFLLYCYYGGMIHIGLHQYNAALQLFLHGITSPTYAVNSITICMFKKFVVVSLMSKHGKIVSLPKYTPGIVQREIKGKCTEYLELEKPFLGGNLDVLEGIITKHTNVYTNDGNMGIVKLLKKASIIRSIQKLTLTYLTLSMDDLAKLVNLSSRQEAEQYVLGMIKNGEIFAKINEKDGMIEFFEDSEKYDSDEIISKIDKVKY